MQLASLVAELITNVPTNKLQKLAATRIFIKFLDSYKLSGLMYIYYAEVILLTTLLCLFLNLFITFKFSASSAAVWADWVLRDQTIVFLLLAFYFLIRKFIQLRAIWKLGHGMSWFIDFSNYIDVLASAGSISLGVYFFTYGPGDYYNVFASIVTLFMWMKGLGHAKDFSKQIATFVLMLNHILRDLSSFILVLLMIMAMFGQAFYILLAVPEDEYVVDDDDPPTIAFQRIDQTFFSLYLMLTGTEPSPRSFEGPWPTILSMSYTIIVFIILLNVLIAIVGDSYDSVLVKSDELFWRSRLLLINEISTVFNFWLSPGAESWNLKIQGFIDKMWNALDVIAGLEEKHPWSNKNSKVMYGFRILLSPAIVAIYCVYYIFQFVVHEVSANILGINSRNDHYRVKELARRNFRR